MSPVHSSTSHRYTGLGRTGTQVYVIQVHISTSHKYTALRHHTGTYRSTSHMCSQVYVTQEYISTSHRYTALRHTGTQLYVTQVHRST